MHTIADLLTLFSESPKAACEATLAALPALLDAAPDVLRSGEGAELVEKIIAESRSDGVGADAVELILERGAAVPSLGSLVSMLSCRDDAQRLRIVRQALARGATPADLAGDKTALAVAAAFAGPEVVQTLAAVASEETRLSALFAALGSNRSNAPKNAELLLDALSDIDRPGEKGLSALHAVALHGSPALLERALARSAEPSRPSTSPYKFVCENCVPADGGFVPHLMLPVGFTALDMVEQAAGIYATLHAAYGKKGGFAPDRAKRLAELEGCLGLLEARGAKHGEPRREGLPAWVSEIDGLLAALGEASGVGAPRVLRAASAVGTTGIGPWTYFSTTLDILGDRMARGPLAERVKSTWLGAVLLGEHRTLKKPRPKGFPKEAQQPLKSGPTLAQRGEAFLVLWMPQPGKAQFVAIAPDKVEVLADDVGTFLRREIAALGVDVDAIARTEAGKMRGPADGPSLQPRILRASYDAPPAADALNRVGGLPIGVTAESWPRREGKPMHHVLTLDLREHPILRPEGKRALAFFVSSPREHEAYAPGNDHVAVLLLGEAELAAGEPAFPADLEGPRLAAGTLCFENGAHLSKKQLLATSHAAWMPTWLQTGDEESLWAAKPGDFVLQFGEDLVPGLSFGDLGVMYVFSKTAWFQCH
ncbi:hypothetical protein [Polyangium sp. y55x31]|uniref:hypothetical protein n=1 Tax=Polyangium sp. y55x31 TaxID=3042688 RepID=UPI002482D1D6|nr:hypothetical protein [Polyangium sp. y55x31]MDI1479158.1 hypothetical protein [Polyangium sp. y55x31]